MATSDKCPRCDCEGNKLACAMCFYYGFKCPGNCACCAFQREAAAQRQAKISNGNDQKESTQNQARVSNSNAKKQSTQKQKRAPLRPLILRDVKKAMVENQKKANSNVPQPNAGNSKVPEPCTNKVKSTAGEADENKVNHAENKLISNKVNSAANESNSNKVSADTETPKPKFTFWVEPELPAAYKEFLRKEKEEKKRRWYSLYFPQWDKVPCEPNIQLQMEYERGKLNVLTKERLEESNKNTIGDHCLNCHCINPRESCDICRRSDFQCLGTCTCCLSFRAGQRVMIFVTPGIYLLPDGSFYGGGNVNLSLAVPYN